MEPARDLLQSAPKSLVWLKTPKLHLPCFRCLPSDGPVAARVQRVDKQPRKHGIDASFSGYLAERDVDFAYWPLNGLKYSESWRRRNGERRWNGVLGRSTGGGSISELSTGLCDAQAVHLLTSSEVMVVKGLELAIRTESVPLLHVSCIDVFPPDVLHKNTHRPSHAFNSLQSILGLRSGAIVGCCWQDIRIQSCQDVH